MRKIGNLLDDSLVRAGIDQKVTTMLVLSEVKKIFLKMFGVGSRYSIVPKGIKEKMLVVEVRSEEDVVELKKREEEILVALETKLKKAAVKRLRFQIR